MKINCPCRELEELRETKRFYRESKKDLLRMSRLNETLRSANKALLDENRQLKAEKAGLERLVEIGPTIEIAYMTAAECLEILGDYIDMELVRRSPPERLVEAYEMFSTAHEKIRRATKGEKH